MLQPGLTVDPPYNTQACLHARFRHDGPSRQDASASGEAKFSINFPARVDVQTRHDVPPRPEVLPGLNALVHPNVPACHKVTIHLYARAPQSPDAARYQDVASDPNSTKSFIYFQTALILFSKLLFADILTARIDVFLHYSKCLHIHLEHKADALGAKCFLGKVNYFQKLVEI